MKKIIRILLFIISMAIYLTITVALPLFLIKKLSLIKPDLHDFFMFALGSISFFICVVLIIFDFIEFINNTMFLYDATQVVVDYLDNKFHEFIKNHSKK